MMLAAVLFATVNALVKALDGLSFLELVWGRSAVGLGFSILSLRLRREAFVAKHSGILVFRGLVGTTGLTMFFYTLHHLPLATATVIQYLSPVFTVLIASFLFREKVSHRQWLALFICFGGVVLIRGFEPSAHPWAIVVGIGSSICSGLAYNVIRKTEGREHPERVVLYFNLVAVILIAPLALSQWTWPSAMEWAGIMAVGLLTQQAQLALTKSFQGGKAGEVSQFINIGLIVAIVVGIVCFQEWPSPMGYLGIFTILMGIGLLVKSKPAAVA